MEKFEENLETNIFDVEQYKKDIKELNELTSRILKNNPSLVRISTDSHDISNHDYIKKLSKIDLKKTNFNPNDKEEIKKDFSGKQWVGESLSHDIIEKSKEKVEETELPPIAKDLKDLNMYGVYAISGYKFNAYYLDLVEEKNEIEVKTEKKADFWNKGTLIENDYPILGLKLFNYSSKLQFKTIPIKNVRLDIAIKDHLNEEFIKIVKELSENNVTDGAGRVAKKPLHLYGNPDESKKVIIKINSISNYIAVKCRRGPANFILASKENIESIMDSYSGTWSNQGKTFKYNKAIESFNYTLIANENIGNTVIMGRCPKDNEPGVNLVINKNTLNNYNFSEDDITGINLQYEFTVLGKNSQNNYFSFEMNRN